MNGLEQVIDRLVTDAEAQLQEHRLDAAQQLADEARAINPSHPRVAFLTAQIGAQRERAVLGKAQRAAAGGDVSAALAVLDDATRGGHRSTLVDEARQQLAQKQIDERVADFVARGRDALGSGALLEPPEQNAHFFIESARALAPNDPAVQLARQDLIARLEGEARKAVAAGNAEQADSWANAAAEAGAEAAEVDSLHASAQQLRGAPRPPHSRAWNPSSTSAWHRGGCWSLPPTAPSTTSSSSHRPNRPPPRRSPPAPPLRRACSMRHTAPCRRRIMRPRAAG